VLEIYTHEMHLKIWGFRISEHYSLQELHESIKPYISAVNLTLGNSKEFYKIGNYKEVDEDVVQYKEGLRQVGAYIDKVNDATFNKIFIPYNSK